MEAAAKLGISVTISKVGIDSTAEATANVTSNERNNDWQPAYTLDEEGLLLQLRTSLVQTLDSMCKNLIYFSFAAKSSQSFVIFTLWEWRDVISWYFYDAKSLVFAARSPLGGFQQIPAQNPSILVVQECIDIITEHQKLLALVKGELAKGLLPHSSVRADYTVQRIRGSFYYLFHILKQ